MKITLFLLSISFIGCTSVPEPTIQGDVVNRLDPTTIHQTQQKQSGLMLSDGYNSLNQKYMFKHSH